MSSFPTSIRLALTTAALCAAAHTAEARARRVVVLDFDGPRQLADTGKTSVVSLLGAQYDVVATRRWETARAAAAKVSHGPAQWSRAARQSGVDAVVEGWVQDEGRHKILNVVVRDASNGREFDTITVRLDGKAGMSADTSQKLATSLDEVLDWIDPGQHEAVPTLPFVQVNTPAGKAVVEVAPDDDGGRPRRRASDDAAPAPRVKRTTDAPTRRPARPSDADPPADLPPARPAEPDDDAPKASHEAAPTEVSTADREAHEIEILFPQGTDERKQLLGARADHVPEKTPRFMIDTGGFITSRSLLWNGDPDGNIPQFAGVSSKGMQVNAAVYPFPLKEIDGVMSGFGFTGSLYHSIGSSVISDEGDSVNEYTLNQNGWELGVHYRAPIHSLVTVDGGVFYGNQTYEIVDASVDFETPDTKYSYIGASAHLDLSITDRATIGFGAKYFTVLDAGDLASTEFFGPVSASGLGLEATFTIPLPSNLYVRGMLSYQKISLQTSGGGLITDDEGVTDGSDSMISGSVNLGIAF